MSGTLLDARAVLVDGARPPGRRDSVHRRLGALLPSLGGVFLAVVVVAGVMGAAGLGLDPATQDLMSGTQPPGPGHLLGTDDLGRDVLARVVAGARGAIVGPLVAAVLSAGFGTATGMLSGYLGGRVATVLMRAVDVSYAIPPMLVLLIVNGVIGGGYWTAVAIIAALGVPTDARIVHSVVSAQRELPYVEAAQTVGLPAWKIMVRHVLPNIVPTVVACALLDFATALVTLSSLSFLGLGVAPGTPDWGLMLAENRAILSVNPWASLVPGALLTMTAASMTVLGDWCHEALARRGSHAR